MRTVSVIMPCFNHAAFVRESAESVLRQTYGAIQLVIVDDCSSDDSWAVITSLAAADSRVMPIRHEQNRGAARSRNDGMRAATGEFLAFCDADDLWEAEKVARQIALLDREPSSDVTYCDARIINGQGVPIGKRFSELFPPPQSPSGCLFPDLVKDNFINTQSVLLRRACVDRMGMFDEDLKGASVEDWWYWIRLSREHKFVYSEECLGRYRIHSGSTGVHRNYAVSRYKVFRRMLAAYPDLPADVQTRALLSMGIDLCDLRRTRVGRRLLWQTMRAAVGHPRTYPTAARALRQLMIRSVRLEGVSRFEGRG
jgi:glycosyltransferase involved in cell wall biosynthesis